MFTDIIDRNGALSLLREVQGAGDESDTPFERLRAVGRSYIAFAEEHPERYRSATTDSAWIGSPELQSQLNSILAKLCAAFDSLPKSRTAPARSPQQLACFYWALLHRVARSAMSSADEPALAQEDVVRLWRLLASRMPGPA